MKGYKKRKGKEEAPSLRPSILMDTLESSNIGVDQKDRRTKFIKAHLDKMSEGEKTRFDFFVRSHFRKKFIKEILDTQLRSEHVEIYDEVAIIVGGLAKLFVGELMDTATDIMREEIHYIDHKTKVKEDGTDGVLNNADMTVEEGGEENENVDSSSTSSNSSSGKIDTQLDKTKDKDMQEHVEDKNQEVNDHGKDEPMFVPARPSGVLPHHITEAILRMRQSGKVSRQSRSKTHHSTSASSLTSSSSVGGHLFGAASGAPITNVYDYSITNIQDLDDTSDRIDF